jgi:CheY-like chemotaxis protein
MSRRFLLIDDDPDDGLIFCEALLDIDPTIACDLEQEAKVAIAKIVDHIVQPDLIFLDLNMPILDGWQVLRAIKSNPGSQSIPVVIYSTSPLDRDIARAKEFGASAYFSKPLDYIELRTNLGSIISAFDKGEFNKIPSDFQY